MFLPENQFHAIFQVIFKENTRLSLILIQSKSH